MSRTFKPLFRPEVLRDRLLSFPMPKGIEEARRKLVNLSRVLTGPAARQAREERHRPDFLQVVFIDLLGYRSVAADPNSYNFVPEFPVSSSGEFPDAVLGVTPRPGTPVSVAVEVKGPLDPLDIPHGGRKKSAVEQGFTYAIDLPCDWIVVTSMADLRLYYKGADRFTCERFDIARLASNDRTLRRFIFLLGADRVVPAAGRNHLYTLFEESKVVGENITNRFYEEYSALLTTSFAALTRENPTLPRTQVLSATQKILDRILFCAFAEDRGLLPPETVRKAYEHTDPYNPRGKWETFRLLFRAINEGNPALNIPRYNGGLFAHDDLLETLLVPDGVCERFRRLGEYNFRGTHAEEALDDEPLGPGTETLVDVEILGHIFEQSITDLEKLRQQLEGLVATTGTDKTKSRRKREGAFYTPRYITRFIVEHALGPVLAERLEALRLRHRGAAAGTAVKALENPAVYEPAALNVPQRDALIAFWLDWQEELGRIRILDPACGSGAFLIEAFDQLLAAYQGANQRLAELRGPQGELLDLNRQILQKNLYGVDLNEEAVEICRLSLWIKTAESGKILTDLDHTIRAGNSIVADPAVHPLAFNWHGAFPEVFAEGGFDVVIGNPPYIRQEWLAPYKEYLGANYRAASGTADLYIYFIERGLAVLRPGGRLGFITSGTFVRGNFATPFRQWLPTVARFSTLVNFGENQPFEDAEMVYPTISILEKRTGPGKYPTLFLHEGIPSSLDEAMEHEGLLCDETVFDGAEWKFQPREITELFNKIMNTGRPLAEVCGGRMYRGILTGLNEAFIIDTPTRDKLVAKDPRSAELLRPILKGEDLRPWYQDWEGRWLVFTRRGVDIQRYPAILEHLEQFRDQLEPRPVDWEGPSDKWPGRKPGPYKWYEIQDSIDYHEEFQQPKVMWAEIAKLPRFSWDDGSLLVINKGYIIPDISQSVLGVAQTRISWFALSQIAVPLRLRGGLWQYQCIHQAVSKMRIPDMGAEDVSGLIHIVGETSTVAKLRHKLHTSTRSRIETDLAPDGRSLTNALTTWWTLDFPQFRTEIKKAFKRDLPVKERAEWEQALAEWKAEHERLTARIVALEQELNERVYRLFNLSPAEVATLEDFMRRTKIFYPLGEV